MNEIYLKITDNIIIQFKSFKNGESDSKTFNSNLMLQLSSIFKFKANGENNKNSQYTNTFSTINKEEDVYVPLTRLEKSVQLKLKESNVYIDDISEKEIENEKLKLVKEKILIEEKEKILMKDNQTLDLESEFNDINLTVNYANLNDITEFNPINQDNDLNFCESPRTLRSSSIFSDANLNNNFNTAKNHLYNETNFENILDTT